TRRSPLDAMLTVLVSGDPAAWTTVTIAVSVDGEPIPFPIRQINRPVEMDVPAGQSPDGAAARIIRDLRTRVISPSDARLPLLQDGIASVLQVFTEGMRVKAQRTGRKLRIVLDSADRSGGELTADSETSVTTKVWFVSAIAADRVRDVIRLLTGG